MKPIKQELPDRRKFLYGLGSSIGAIAFSNLLAAENTLTSLDVPKLQPQPMLTAKAKSCIFLTMEGGPSHIDTFDPKSKLTELHLKKFERTGQQFSAMSQGNRYFVQSPFSSRKVGKSGADISSPFVHLPNVADNLVKKPHSFTPGRRRCRSAGCPSSRARALSRSRSSPAR